jgi:hypothetical protein
MAADLLLGQRKERFENVELGVDVFPGGATCGGSRIHRSRGGGSRHREDILFLVSSAIHRVVDCARRTKSVNVSRATYLYGQRPRESNP